MNPSAEKACFVVLE